MVDEEDVDNYDVSDGESSHEVTRAQLKLAMLSMELNLTDRQSSAVTRYAKT
jgi:hypothetical protein